MQGHLSSSAPLFVAVGARTEVEGRGGLAEGGMEGDREAGRRRDKLTDQKRVRACIQQAERERESKRERVRAIATPRDGAEVSLSGRFPPFQHISRGRDAIALSRT